MTATQTVGTPRPLAGMRALDVSNGVAASFTARTLADFGADVIKVEPPGGGADRTLGPFPDGPDPERGGMFLYLNANKRGVVVDRAVPRGAAVLADLVRAAHVVVVGDSAADVDALYAACPAAATAREDGRILTAVTGYGLTGPYRDRPAEELNLFGFGGPLLATGSPEREPVAYPEYVALLQAGLAGALATVITHIGRLPGVVDVSVAEVLLGSWDRRAYSLQAYQYWQHNPAARMHSHAMAFGTYPCKDGTVTLAAQGSRLPRLLTMIERTDLVADPRFAGFSATFDATNFAAFNEILTEWLGRHTRDEVFRVGQAHGVLVAPVLAPGEVLADPHLADRGFWQWQADRGLDYPLPGPPLLLHDDQPPPVRPAPRLGEHTDQVLGELGYSPDTLSDLHRDGVL